MNECVLMLKNISILFSFAIIASIFSIYSQGTQQIPPCPSGSIFISNEFGKQCYSAYSFPMVLDWYGGLKQVDATSWNKDDTMLWPYWHDPVMDTKALKIQIDRNGNYNVTWNSAAGNAKGGCGGATFHPYVTFGSTKIHLPSIEINGGDMQIVGEGDNNKSIKGSDLRIKSNYDNINYVRFQLNDVSGIASCPRSCPRLCMIHWGNPIYIQVVAALRLGKNRLQQFEITDEDSCKAKSDQIANILHEAINMPAVVPKNIGDCACCSAF